MTDVRRQRLETLGHLLTALVIGLKGLDKLTHAGKTGLGLFLLAGALLVLVAAVFHHWVEARLRSGKGLVFLAEGLAVGAIGWTYLSEGRQYLQYACGLAALLNLALGVFHLMRARRGGPAAPPPG